MLYDYLIQGIGREDFAPEDARIIFEFFGFDTEILSEREALSKKVWGLSNEQLRFLRELLKRRSRAPLSRVLKDIENIQRGVAQIRDPYLRQMCLRGCDEDKEYADKLLDALLDGVDPVEPKDWVKLFLGDNAWANAFFLMGAGFPVGEYVKWRLENPAGDDVIWT